MNQLEPDNAEWVRRKIAERGMTAEIESEAQRRVNARGDRRGDLTIRWAGFVVVFAIVGGLLWGYGMPWWTYLVGGALSAWLTK